MTLLTALESDAWDVVVTDECIEPTSFDVVDEMLSPPGDETGSPAKAFAKSDACCASAAEATDPVR
ncbi:MAG TPA: hypothetical protein VN715_00425, partial [Roseiarcus sp.]|nr:hypothetical protein [Roseiarcus sp.]